MAQELSHFWLIQDTKMLMELHGVPYQLIKHKKKPDVQFFLKSNGDMKEFPSFWPTNKYREYLVRLWTAWWVCKFILISNWYLSKAALYLLRV